jgi:hypothetical protein
MGIKVGELKNNHVNTFRVRSWLFKEMNEEVHLSSELFCMFMRFATTVPASSSRIVKNNFRNWFQHKFTYTEDFQCCETKFLKHCFKADLLDNVFKGLGFTQCS